MVNPQPEEYGKVYQWAQKTHLIKPEDTSVVFLNWDVLNHRLDHIRQTFPDNVLHAIAVKSNALPAVLAHINYRGFGLESASMEELRLAMEYGGDVEKMVLDSPVKTTPEILECNKEYKGMYLNVNVLEELGRLPDNQDMHIGIRVNPMVKVDVHEMLNVTKGASKFGVPITQREAIIEAALDNGSVTGLHMHSGSGMGEVEQNVEAIERVYKLAKDINAELAKREEERICWIDIGGGIKPAPDKDGVSIVERYVKAIQDKCPNLFEEFKVLTEFGAYIHTNHSWVVSEVEYVSEYFDNPIAYIHVGADMFLRKVYADMGPEHHVSVLNGTDFRLKKGNEMPHDIAGPLCFAGDFLFRELNLPTIKPQDKLVINNVGGNTLSMWSRHCSRDMPKVIGYSLETDKIGVVQERKRV